MNNQWLDLDDWRKADSKIRVAFKQWWKMSLIWLIYEFKLVKWNQDHIERQVCSFAAANQTLFSFTLTKAFSFNNKRPLHLSTKNKLNKLILLFFIFHIRSIYVDVLTIKIIFKPESHIWNLKKLSQS